MLNDLTRPDNHHDCQFRKPREMARKCHYVWMHFFLHLEPGKPRVDLAVWEIGQTVSVRPASTAIDESHPDFAKPYPQYFEIKGYRREQSKAERRKGGTPESIAAELEALERELFDSVVEAIVAGLEYKNAREAYEKSNPDGKPFAALATTQDQGLHASEFTLVWKNDRGPTVAQVRKKVAAAREKPLPSGERGQSDREQHLERYRRSEKRQKEAARKYWEAEKAKAEKRKPAARKRLAARIAEGQAELSSAKRAAESNGRARHFLLSLDDGNQTSRALAPKVSLDRLVEIHTAYRWSNFDEYDNRVWEYSYALLEPALKKARVKRRETLWAKLNRPQKILFAFLEFVGQSDNGGVWQFLFNVPELSLAALETMEEIGAAKLAADYRKTLEEFVGKARSVADLRRRFEDENLSSAKRWSAFVEGYGQLQTTKTIEKYLFTARFKAGLFKKASDYVESSLHLLARVPEASAS